MNIIIANFILFLHKQLEDNKSSLILWIPVLQGIGIIIYFSLATEPQSYIVACIVFILLVSLILIALRMGYFISLSIFFILLGFVTVYLKAHYFSGNALRTKVYGKDIVGTVEEISNKQSHKKVVVCDVQNVKYNVKCIQLVSRTQWDSNIEVGDRILLSAIIYPPQAAVSPFSYDFSRVSYFKKINGIGFTISNVKLFEKRKNKKILEYIELIRLRIYKLLLRNLSGETANIVSALLIGKKDGISNNIMEDIRNSGIAHLFAISGLHLSFIAGLFFSLSRNLLVFSRRMAENYNIKKISAVIAVIVSLIYLLLAGMPVSAQRAFIMTTYVFIGILIDRRHDNFRSITLAALIVLLFYPEAVLNPSFQMSFAAVLALIASCDIFTKLIVMGNVLQYFTSIVLSSLIAGLATLPYVIYHFNNFSIAGIFANVLAIPITTFFIMPLSLLYIILSLFRLEFCISYALESFVKLLLYISSYISKMDSFILAFHAFSSVAILIITLGFLFLCLWNGSLRFLGLVVIVYGFFIGFRYVTPDILVSINNIVVKESDGQLYSVNKKARITSFISLVWAKQNGQHKLLKHDLKNNQWLFCEKGKGCIYNKQKMKVLIAYMPEYIIQNCLNIDLVIQFGKFIYPQECHRQHVSYVDIVTNGPYFVWILDDKVKINRLDRNRIWNM